MHLSFRVCSNLASCVEDKPSKSRRGSRCLVISKATTTELPFEPRHGIDTNSLGKNQTLAEDVDKNFCNGRRVGMMAGRFLAGGGGFLEGR